MRTSHYFASSCLSLTIILMAAAAGLAADPGIRFPSDDPVVNDQRPGSVLVYNLYSSSAANPNAENTRINITNTSDRLGVVLHVFFIDGSTCGQADLAVCLTANQTTSFLASDIDPGVTGYIIAVAVDRTTGCPVSFNRLIGDALIKLASGHAANLAAEGIAAVPPDGTLMSCDGTSSTATLTFSGAPTAYSALPRVLAIDNLPSALDGNSTLLVVNNLTGDLVNGINTVGSVFGILYDDLEHAQSFSFPQRGCQLKGIISDTFPRTTPRFKVVVPNGHTGWMKIWSGNGNIPLLGAVINFNPTTATNAAAFSQGHNLHKLTLAGPSTLIVPVFTPSLGCRS